MGSTYSSKLCIGAAVRLLAVFAIAGSLPIPAAAQGSLENRYLNVSMFGGGAADGINLSGRFQIIDRQTGITILRASHLGDLGLLKLGSFITIRIDGGAPPIGTTNPRGWDVLMGDVTGNAGWLWTRPPTNLGGRIFAQGITQLPAPPIEVATEIILIGDMAQFKFTIVNRDSSAHTVGIRFAQDYDIGNFNKGPVIPNNGTQICTETELNGALVPASWIRSEKINFERNPAGDPLLPIPSAGGLLRPRTAGPNFWSPDRFVIAAGFNFSTLGVAQQGLWDWVPTTLPGFDFCRDPWEVGAAVYWNPRLLTPGQSAEIVTYFGRNRANIDPEGPLAVGVEGPLSLSVVQGALQPVPSAIVAFAKNLSGVTLTNVTATIALPPGLQLESGQSPTLTAATLIPFQDAFFQWQVRPTGNISGRLTYSVSITAGPGLIGKSITGEIEIPALPANQTIIVSNPSASGTGGLPVTFVNMVSIPYFLQDPSPASGIVVRDETGRQLNFNLGEFALLRWNERLGQYETVQFVRPGEGYWLITRRQASVACTQLSFKLDANNAAAVSTLSEFDLPLQLGWNQIGNPFLFSLRFSDVIIVPTDANDPDRLKPHTVQLAAQRGLILAQMYEYDPRLCNYTPPNLGLNTEMIPFRGYWIKALTPGLRILFRPAIGRAADVTRSTVLPQSPGPNGWSLGIVAKTDNALSGWNSLGVAAGASDGPDIRDLETPPAIAPQLTVAFMRPDWPVGRAGAYLRDIQAADGRPKSWNVAVSTPEPNTEITVAWPEINRVPRGYELYITDRSNGQRRSMRQTSSIRVNTGSASSRTFTITAEPRRAGALTISSLIVRPVGRGSGTAAAISFVATQDANVQVRILRAGGSLLRNLATRSASAGETSVTWDLKDNKGVAVPSGAYTIEVKASGSEGQSARQVAPYLVIR